MKLAFIGLGTMGAPMAQRLVDAGYDVTVHNRSREREAQIAGAKRAASPQKAAEGQDVVFTMVSDTPDAEAVTRRVRESGIPVSNLLHRQASLEDVFLKLTGRRLVD